MEVGRRILRGGWEGIVVFLSLLACSELKDYAIPRPLIGSSTPVVPYRQHSFAYQDLLEGEPALFDHDHPTAYFTSSEQIN